MRRSGQDAIAHIRSRRISPKTAFQFRLGFANKIGGLYKNLSSEGIHVKDMMLSGLILENVQSNDSAYFDRFRGRLMIPISDACGDVIGFGGRIMGNASNSSKYNHSSNYKPHPKYVNSPDTPLFKKGSVLFGLHLAKTAIAERGCLIVEGYFDVICLHDIGFDQTVGILGSAVSKEQIEASVRHCSRKIVTLLFDADEAGDKAIDRACEVVLPQVSETIEIRIAKLVDKNGEHFNRGHDKMSTMKDPAELCSSLPRHKAIEAFDGVLDRAVEWKIWHLIRIFEASGIHEDSSASIDKKVRDEVMRKIVVYLQKFETISHREQLITFAANKLTKGKPMLQHEVEVKLSSMIDSRRKASSGLGSTKLQTKRGVLARTDTRGDNMSTDAPLPEIAHSIESRPSSVTPTLDVSRTIAPMMNRVHEAESILLSVFLHRSELRQDVRDLIEAEISGHSYEWLTPEFKELWRLMSSISEDRSGNDDGSSFVYVVRSQLASSLSTKDILRRTITGDKVANKSIEKLKAYIQQAFAVLHDHSLASHRSRMVGAALKCADDLSEDAMGNFGGPSIEQISMLKLLERLEAEKDALKEASTFASLGKIKALEFRGLSPDMEVTYDGSAPIVEDAIMTSKVDIDDSSDLRSDDVTSYDFGYSADDFDNVLPDGYVDDFEEAYVEDSPMTEMDFISDDNYDNKRGSHRIRSSHPSDAGDDGYRSTGRGGRSTRKRAKDTSGPQIQPQWAKEEPSGKKAPSERRIPGGFYDLGATRVRWDDDNIII